MKNILLPLLLFLGFQNDAQEFRQPGNIENLKKRLPYLKGDEKLECLNNIAVLYFSNGSVQSDSALLYAKRSVDYLVDATNKLKFFKAAHIYAKVLLQFSRADEGLRYYELGLKIATELKSDVLTAISYRGIGEALWYKGNFQQSVKAIKLCIPYFKKIDNLQAVSEASMVISSIYGDQGNYEEAFAACLDALRLSEDVDAGDNTVLCLAQMGDLYKKIGDYKTALDYYRRGFSYHPGKNSWCYRHLSNCTGDLFCELRDYGTAYRYYINGLEGHPGSKTSRLRLAEYHLLRKNYDSAFVFFRGLYNELQNTGEGNILIYSMLGMGKIFYAKHNLKLAMKYGMQALQMSRQKGTKQIIRDAGQLLSSVYEELKQPDSALLYYKDYVQAKDSIITNQFKGKLYAFRQTSEDEKKLEQIESLKRQKIAGSRFTKILVGVILLLGLLSLILYRNSKLRRKNQKLQTQRMEAEWQRRAGDLEMQALRAQMNPHFIFNCLSSINKFILKNEADKASDYLTRFSRLIRLVLLNSQKPLIVLEDEVEMLRLYIEMEKLRFKNSFEYTITYTNDIEPSSIFIPPLLLQPFCENAIWHGLMHKEGPGQLHIFLEMHDDMVVCTITDNGIGRAKALEIKSKSAERIKSLGLKLTSERLALFNAGTSVQTFYKMEDVLDNGNIAGTRVKVNIRYKEGIEKTTEKVNND